MKTPNRFPNQNKEAGGGLLMVVTTLGLVMALVQGTMYYKSKTGAKFITSEKGKVLAQQVAEAGVEDNIAAIGNRRLTITSSMHDYTTAAGKAVGSGAFNSKVSMVASGPIADTVDLVSTGSVGNSNQSVQARLRLKKYIDTVITPRVTLIPETTAVIGTHAVVDTTKTVKVKDPETMPPLNSTPAYAACMGSAEKKCDICHVPSLDISKADVVSVSKPSIDTHFDHHGDYVTTDGTCDLYKPFITITLMPKSVKDTTLSIVDKSIYDTTVSIDTLFKVQILSWK